MTKISKHFTDKEFFDDQDFEDIVEAGHEPAWHISLKLLGRLEILRSAMADEMGEEICLKINSAYRSHEHNEEVGGTCFSFHKEGKAADVVAYRKITGELVPAETVQKVVRENIKDGGLGCYRIFTHVDVRESLHLVSWEG